MQGSGIRLQNLIKTFKKSATFLVACIALLGLTCLVANTHNTIVNNQFYIKDYTDVGKLQAKYNGCNKYGVVVVQKGDQKDTFVLSNNDTEYLPFTYGNGEYRVDLYETDGKSETCLKTLLFDIELKDETIPFQGLSYYTNYKKYSSLSEIANKFKELDDQDYCDSIFTYVTSNISYDNSRASDVELGKLQAYKPDLDMVLKEKQGICLDQASLTASLFKLHGIPSRLVFGYYKSEYHSWVEAWISGKWYLYDTTNNLKYNDVDSSAYKVVKYY